METFEIKNKDIKKILADWEMDFRGAVDVSDFRDEENFLNMMIDELLPEWISRPDEKLDAKLYKKYLDRLIEIRNRINKKLL